MKDNDGGLLLGYVFVICLACVLIFAFGDMNGTKVTRKAATEAGAGYWKVDPKTGKTEWAWRSFSTNEVKGAK